MNIEIFSESIKKLADQLSRCNLSFHRWNDRHLLDSNDVEEIAQFFFIGNSINYKFWYNSSQQKYKYKNYTGSAAMWASMKDKKKLINLESIASGNNIEMILDPLLPMRTERTKSLLEAGEVLLDSFSGSVLKLCDQAEWHAPTIVEIITEHFPMWKDQQRKIKFNKRAQLFVAMLHGKLGAESKIRDIDKLSCLADYQLPRVLRHFGVLNYSNKLTQTIDNEILICRDSDLEIEIRLATIEAMDLICDELKIKHNLRVSPIQLDYILWAQAKGISKPHHLTPTIAY
ncbi:queuosine salvage family protein [Paenibacillus xylanexedens]|uniref:Queuosine 5'-phosphate N-glycosylase/hydrolase n=1 Tax=Paenibacillus xylanexedens TaxID=528191 RepID=A0ABS4RSG7_PAEXY|nr:queuosine salvage family protein [Paenibacillus xylanexedens]MBP2245826.1 hypothetical protein [Paenibacillus xylanexedens]